MARRYFLFLSLRGSLQTNRSWPGKEKGTAVPVGGVGNSCARAVEFSGAAVRLDGRHGLGQGRPPRPFRGVWVEISLMGSDGEFWKTLGLTCFS